MKAGNGLLRHLTSLLSGKTVNSATIYDAVRASTQSPRERAAPSETTESDSDDTGLNCSRSHHVYSPAAGPPAGPEKVLAQVAEPVTGPLQSLCLLDLPGQTRGVVRPALGGNDENQKTFIPLTMNRSTQSWKSVP